MAEESTPEAEREDLERMKIWAEVERFKTKEWTEVLRELAEIYKEYNLRMRKMVTLGAWLMLGLIFACTALLTYSGKVSGSTFSFVAGTIVGYIITLLKK